MKDKTIVLNAMCCQPGEILERSRNYVIKKDSDGRMICEFVNRGQETDAVKITITALEKNSVFFVKSSDGANVRRKANCAGVLECRLPIPAGQTITLVQEG